MSVCVPGGPGGDPVNVDVVVVVAIVVLIVLPH